MTWQTHRVISSESGNFEATVSEDVATDKPFTGNYSIYNFAGPSLAIELDLPTFTSLKVGFWRNVEWDYSSNEFFRFMNISNVELGVIIYDDINRVIEIQDASDIVQASILAYSTPIKRMDYRWYHIGMFTNSSITSLYINGKKYMTAAHALGGYKIRLNRSLGIGNAQDFIDDICIQYSADDEFDEAPPGYRYYPRKVTYSVQTEWETHSPNPVIDSQVFETPNNADTSYIESDEDEQRQLYRIQNVPFQVPFGYVSKTTTVQGVGKYTGQGDVKVVVSDGLNELVSPDLNITNTYAMFQHTWDYAPDGSELSNDKVNQLNYGVESEGIE